MAEKYTDRIRLYCDQNGIEMPPGFFRHAASRYVAVDIGCQPARLVATTWFKQEDMLYYVTRLASGKTLKLLDFKERTVLRFSGGETLERGDAF
ncbi:MAG: hypothetical protein WAO95_07045 [Burkholderiales bacterium]